MAKDAMMVIKTTSETKELIKCAAERLGLSVNSFVIMVAKNAAGSDEIVLKNDSDEADLSVISRAEEYNANHKASATWDELKAQYGV
ncbi:MAG: DUF1778 domain-containing protein [Candidatus Nomurabacteria bacterium]|jgi:antitoxin component of RelBE/YafQ-DinJ toxin-antitoxin module|nr:DUF1778 domain-containing protein [Candidatus Nomurabacteria bacterium]